MFWKKDKDPTSGWPEVVRGYQPALDLALKSVGPLRLGDPLDDAQKIGRPKELRRSPGKNQILEYGAFQLEFGDGRLICAAFDVDEGTQISADGAILSRTTTPTDAQFRLGTPTANSTGDGLQWLDYERDGATLALEFDENGLTCVQLYGEGYA